MPKKRKARSQVPQEELAADGEDVKRSVPGTMKGDHGSDGQGSAQHDEQYSTLDSSEVDHFNIPFGEKTIVCERRGEGGKPSLIFTHGAGGGLTNPATKDFTDGFAEKAGIVSFKGAMNLQSRIKTYHAVMEHEDFDAALGGRSMGARAATVAATQEDHETKALVLVSFPLIGGKKKESREQILLDLPENIDVLFISGDKDTMCDLEQLAEVQQRMSAPSWLIVVEAANHSMDWKWKDTAQEMRRLTGSLAAEWLVKRDKGTRRCLISWDEEAGMVHCGAWKESEEEAKRVNEKKKRDPPAKKRKTK